MLAPARTPTFVWLLTSALALLASPCSSLARRPSHPSLARRVFASSDVISGLLSSNSGIDIPFNIPDCDGCQRAIDLADGCLTTQTGVDFDGVVAACFCNLSLYGALETCLDCQAGLDPSILDVAQKTTDKLGSTCDSAGIFLERIVLEPRPSSSRPTSTPSSSQTLSIEKLVTSSTRAALPTTTDPVFSLPGVSSLPSIVVNATSIPSASTASSSDSLEAPSATPSMLVEGAVSAGSRRWSKGACSSVLLGAIVAGLAFSLCS